jgi:hypothetical protein
MVVERLLRSVRSELKGRAALRELREIAAGDRPILAGPFFTEIGFEVLYWIPFVNWFKTEFGIAPERIVAISRGGAEGWYRHITANYHDVFDLLTLEEFKRKNEARIAANKGNRQDNAPKHLTVSELDREILGAVAKRAGIAEYAVLHPSQMFKFMGAMRSSPELKYTKYELFRPSEGRHALGFLPDDYVAVKFWFGGQFRDTEENRRFVKDLIGSLARTNNVVLLNTGLEVERTDAFDKWFNELDFGAKNVHSIRAHVTLRNNLDVQTEVIRRAKLFVGTYGGFAYAAPFTGVPAVTFYSREDAFVYDHLEMLRKALRRLRSDTNRRMDLVPFDVRLFSQCAAQWAGLLKGASAPTGGDER